MEKEIIMYLVKSGLCMGVFMLVYHLFLRRSTFFRFNRIYLLAGLILSFIIPFVQYNYDVYIPYELSNTFAANTLAGATAEHETLGVDVWKIISYVYGGFVFLMLIRTIWSATRLMKLTRVQQSKLTEKYVLIDSEQIKSPFSVFNYILLNTKRLSPTERELIIKHEISHIRQKHWVDLIIGQLVLIVQCFNPLAWKYVSLQKENHEYLADKAVIDDGISPALYRAVLINQRFEGPVFSFSNSFNLSNPLSRLNMITSTKSAPWKKIAALIIIPFMIIYIWGSAQPNYIFETPVSSTMAYDLVSPSGGSTMLITQMRTIPHNTAGAISAIRVRGQKNVLYVDGGGTDSLRGKVNVYINGFSYGDTILANSRTSAFWSRIPSGKGIALMPNAVNQNRHIALRDSLITRTNNHLSYFHSFTSTSNGKGRIPTGGPSPLSDAMLIIDGEDVSMIDFESINPNDIESIVILKDKDAVKQYGEKAKNGVIQIITKKKLNA